MADKPKRQLDLEIKTLADILKLLACLSEEERQRVLKYLRSRFPENNKPGETV